MTVRARFALIAAVGLGLMLSGCEHMYGGVDKGVATRGLANVGAVKRGENLYDVVYIGNDKAPDAYRRDMALMQSAELCKAQGFKYFKASDTQTFSNHATPARVDPADAPQLTLQVSCYQAQETELVAEVDTVIARISSQYSVN